MNKFGLSSVHPDQGPPLAPLSRDYNKILKKMCMTASKYMYIVFSYLGMRGTCTPISKTPSFRPIGLSAGSAATENRSITENRNLGNGIILVLSKRRQIRGQFKSPVVPAGEPSRCVQRLGGTQVGSPLHKSHISRFNGVNKKNAFKESPTNPKQRKDHPASIELSELTSIFYALSLVK